MQPARQVFRLLTRARGGYNGATMHDVQLQVIETGQLIWAQTFTDHEEARDYRRDVGGDLATLDDAAFRQKRGVPSRLRGVPAAR